jgi:hypothetical protein
MFYKSMTVWLFVVLWAGALQGQADDTAAYPTHPLAPVIIPWEPNGADYKLHTRELDSRFLGFFAQNKLKKVEVSGGVTQTVCNEVGGRGGTIRWTLGRVPVE